MAQYGATPEGVIALKTMSAAIFSAAEKINDLCGTLATEVSDKKNLLGPHASNIEAVIENIEAEMKKAAEPVNSISAILNTLADGYQEEIDLEGPGSETGK